MASPVRAAILNMLQRNRADTESARASKTSEITRSRAYDAARDTPGFRSGLLHVNDEISGDVTISVRNPTEGSDFQLQKVANIGRLPDLAQAIYITPSGDYSRGPAAFFPSPYAVGDVDDQT